MLPRDHPQAKRVDDYMKDLEDTNRQETAAIDAKRDAGIHETLEESFSHIYRDGAGGFGVSRRSSWALGCPWRATVKLANGEVVEA